MIWRDSITCRSRMACLDCRTDAAFRASVERRFGPVICPEGWPVGSEPPAESLRRVMVAVDRQTTGLNHGGCGNCGQPASFLPEHPPSLHDKLRRAS